MASRARVMIVGAGAREHALGVAIARGGHELLVAPGNAGTEAVGRNLPVAADDVGRLVDIAAAHRADLVVVGPEAPLSLGLVDALAARGLRAFGPTRAAARLESSKAFMKRFCERHGIPTAPFAVFDDADAAVRHTRASARPPVIKADGLAAGKGVFVPDTLDAACLAIDRIMCKREFGEAGRCVVIEERLEGEEVSFHVVCDGARAVALAPAQDHKRVGDGDTGPNTGGMGALAPTPVVTTDVEQRILREIVQPTLDGMAAEGAPFRGALFVGLMIERGMPRVLEYNVRFGDPEATVLVPTYDGDWFELLDASARGNLSGVGSMACRGAALSVVMAAAGYPGRPQIGDRIFGLDRPRPAGAFVYHAGTRRLNDGAVETAGGRVLAAGAHASTLEVAARLAYETVAQIQWTGEHHRHDIGRRALEEIHRPSLSASPRA
ncbi:MAG TPA: phosphoribosylamine--glycine ligase [Polyangiaceae bacterium]|nr:phosphoribosylamine--glycine ligase [Polyangiaceae bacterium]